MRHHRARQAAAHGADHDRAAAVARKLRGPQRAPLKHHQCMRATKPVSQRVLDARDGQAVVYENRGVPCVDTRGLLALQLMGARVIR